jgi:hypothetical protein
MGVAPLDDGYSIKLARALSDFVSPRGRLPSCTPNFQSLPICSFFAMKFFSLLLAAPLVSALVQRDGPLSLNPPTDNLVPVTHENAVAHYPELAADVARRHYTNAQRLARGLSPNPPLSVRKTLKSRTPTRVQHGPPLSSSLCSLF